MNGPVILAGADTSDPTTALVRALTPFVPRSSGERNDLEQVHRLIRTGDPWTRTTSFHLTCSAVVVHRETASVLLRFHERIGRWMQVGGHAEPGEDDPYQITLREAAEETHLTDLVAWPDERASLFHVVVVSVPESTGEPAHIHGDLRYLLVTGYPEQAHPEHAGAPLRWVEWEEALRETGEENLRESFRRVGQLLGTPSGDTDPPAGGRPVEVVQSLSGSALRDVFNDER